MEEQIALLLSKDNQQAYQALCALLERAKTSDEEMAFFTQFAEMLGHSSAYVRIRGLLLLAANAKWDKEGRLAGVLEQYLDHLQEEKPIVVRKCLEGLKTIVQEQRELAPRIQDALMQADFSGYRDSMRPLLEKDRQQVLSSC